MGDSFTGKHPRILVQPTQFPISLESDQNSYIMRFSIIHWIKIPIWIPKNLHRGNISFLEFSLYIMLQFYVMGLRTWISRGQVTWRKNSASKFDDRTLWVRNTVFQIPKMISWELWENHFPHGIHSRYGRNSRFFLSK